MKIKRDPEPMMVTAKLMKRISALRGRYLFENPKAHVISCWDIVGCLYIEETTPQELADGDYMMDRLFVWSEV